MTPEAVSPPSVPAAAVRRLSPAGLEMSRAPRAVAVPVVPSPTVVPRQIDPAGLRLMALQLENEQLRAELEQLRTG